MADELIPSSEGPDDAWVRALLGDLDHLRPEADPGPSEPMPPWVWARVSSALATEGGAERRRPGWIRWGGGLVAASFAVLAMGVAVTAFMGGNSDQAVVADAAPEALLSAPSAAARSGVSQAPMLSFAGMVPPVLRMTDSQTDYTPTTLGDQVTDLLASMDMAPEAAMAAMKSAPAELPVPDPEPSGILESPTSLRDCITELTDLATSTALLLDWSTYLGEDAGVIVTPEYSESQPTQPDMRELDVWVVDGDCDVKMGLHLSMP